MQEIYEFAKNRFGAPRYKEAERRLRALAREMYEESLIPESLEDGLSENEQVYHHRFFDYFPERSCIVADGKTSFLRPIPNQIMSLLSRIPNRFISGSKLSEIIYGDEMGVEAVRAHVRFLRSELSINGLRFNVIESAHGKGYRLVDPDKDPIKLDGGVA